MDPDIKSPVAVANGGSSPSDPSPTLTIPLTEPSGDIAAFQQSCSINDKNLDEVKYRRKTTKGKVDSADIRKHLSLADEPQINHITCNQTQEYFAVATNIGFEIIQNDSSSDRLKKKCQNLGESVELIEMMYKTNIIVLVFSR
jgi:hypothetical protein